MKRYLSVFCAVAAVMAVTAAATPSGGQSAETEVASVSGGAYGAWVEVRSDLAGPIPIPLPSPILEDLVAAAEAEDAAGVQAALESAGIDPTASPAPAEGGTVVLGNGPAPEVTLPAEGGGPFSDSLATFDLDGDQIAGLSEVSTEGALGPDGFAASTANIGELSVLGLLGGELISSDCLADLDGTSGTTELLEAGGIISGDFPVSPAPNTPSPFNIDVTLPFGPGTITIEYVTMLNEQFTEGTELTVNAMHTFLSIRADEDGPGTAEPEIVILEVEGIFAQSRCGVVEAAVVTPPTAGPVPATPTFTG